MIYGRPISPYLLAHQVASLANAPHAGVCHCAVQFLFGTDIKPDLRAAGAEAANCQVSVDPLAPPAKMSALYASLNYFSTAFAVPSSVMLRRTALAASGLLDPQIPFFGDYEMLVKIGGTTYGYFASGRPNDLQMARESIFRKYRPSSP